MNWYIVYYKNNTKIEGAAIVRAKDAPEALALGSTYNLNWHGHENANLIPESAYYAIRVGEVNRLLTTKEAQRIHELLQIQPPNCS